MHGWPPLSAPRAAVDCACAECTGNCHEHCRLARHRCDTPLPQVWSLLTSTAPFASTACPLGTKLDNSWRGAGRALVPIRRRAGLVLQTGPCRGVGQKVYEKLSFVNRVRNAIRASNGVMFALCGPTRQRTFVRQFHAQLGRYAGMQQCATMHDYVAYNELLPWHAP